MSTASIANWQKQPEQDMVLIKAKNQSYLFQDEVNITFEKNFYIAKYPVTQALWKAVMDGHNPAHFKGDHRPIENVSWKQINEEFLPKLKEKTGINYRLPSETEWEYAARGGQHWQDGYTYAGSNRLKEVGWYDDNSHSETKPVGLKQPNQIGLYDMSGNVWEWCADHWYTDEEIKKMPKNGSPWTLDGDKDLRVLRGGSWDYGNNYGRVAYRFRYYLNNRDFIIGFRLARY